MVFYLKNYQNSKVKNFKALNNFNINFEKYLLVLFVMKTVFFFKWLSLETSYFKSSYQN